VTVDGRGARWTWSDGEIVITPKHALRDNEKFAVTVRYTATPFVPTNNVPFGFFTVNAGSVTAGQPNFSHTFYPVNDHPADKASYDISFDVPAGTTAVANGDLVLRRTSHGRSYSEYFMREPMASELIQLTVGAFDITTRPSVRGVHVRDVSSTTATAAVEPALARTPDHLRWMIDEVGRYPFNAYGVEAADQGFGYALETQTLSLHPAVLLQQLAGGPQDALLHHRHVDVEEHAVALECEAPRARRARDDETAGFGDLQLPREPFGAVSDRSDDDAFHHAHLVLPRLVLRRGRRAPCLRKRRRRGLCLRRHSGRERDHDEKSSFHDCTWPISVAVWTKSRNSRARGAPRRRRSSWRRSGRAPAECA